jgi:hypothetical protein
VLHSLATESDRLARAVRRLVTEGSLDLGGGAKCGMDLVIIELLSHVLGEAEGQLVEAKAMLASEASVSAANRAGPGAPRFAGDVGRSDARLRVKTKLRGSE